jgi:uncharacterized protein YndB with AHSA1/START domain
MMNTMRRALVSAAVVAPALVSAGARAARMNPDVGPLAITKRALVPASASAVWRAWTDPAVITAYFAPQARVELRIGGAYELLFLASAPEGQRGSEGCTILAYEPDRMLSFSWNAPPDFARERDLLTWVVVLLEPQDANATRVTLTHRGFGTDGAWPQVHAYFDRAWGSVLDHLVAHFSGGSQPFGEKPRAG